LEHHGKPPTPGPSTFDGRVPADSRPWAGIVGTGALRTDDGGCPGCGKALAARHVVDAAMRACDRQLIAVCAPGCLEDFAALHAVGSPPVASMHAVVGNAAAIASGIAAALAAQGRSHVRVIAQGDDGGTTDIGFGCLSAMFERNDDVLYVCYDSESPARGSERRSRAALRAATSALEAGAGHACGTASRLPLIAMAHGIPYVATASAADVRDVESKVAAAMTIRGARYVHIHSPCPLAWGYEPADTVEVGRLAVQSGLFPLFEARHGEIISRTTLRHAVAVTDYLRLQMRFSHLFGASDDTGIARIQAIADRNIREFALQDDGDDR
jgi:pyruvate ferredoxin oxidoreductase beta subunit